MLVILSLLTSGCASLVSNAASRFGENLSGAILNQDDPARLGRMLSQFGWHFEHQVIPEGGGPQFVVEFVPLIAGVEYGKLIQKIVNLGWREKIKVSVNLNPVIAI